MSRIKYKVHQVSQNTFKTLSIIATPQTVGALETISQLLEPFKYAYPKVHVAKASVDFVKEIGKFAMLTNGVN